MRPGSFGNLRNSNSVRAPLRLPFKSRLGDAADIQIEELADQLRTPVRTSWIHDHGLASSEQGGREGEGADNQKHDRPTVLHHLANL